MLGCAGGSSRVSLSSQDNRQLFVPHDQWEVDVVGHRLEAEAVAVAARHVVRTIQGLDEVADAVPPAEEQRTVPGILNDVVCRIGVVRPSMGLSSC